VLSVAAIVVVYCSSSIYKVFKTHTYRPDMTENIRVQKFLFRLLVVQVDLCPRGKWNRRFQSAIPLFFYSLPGIFYVSFPLWDPKWGFGFHAPFMSMVLVLPKFIDSIVTVLIIPEYRRAVADIMVGRRTSKHTDDMNEHFFQGDRVSTISSGVTGTETRNAATQA
jgi:hypothetical protein